MSSTTKRRLKIYLPIAIAVILVGIIIAIILLNNRITAKDYFDALNNSNYTKQVQNTTITENETLIYEKIETIIFDGDNVYHKIEEKQLSSDLDKDYDETTTEFYYSKDKMYYFENNVWNTEAFTVSKKLKTYELKTDYFKTIKFNKKIESEGHLQGEIRNDCVEKIVSNAELHSMTLLIVVNKDFDVQKFNINAKTSSSRDVEITNIYTYVNETVVLPA
ncbi:MAG: hypothetical protein IJ415_02060 [Clostridia bacterium]|nr:hypothetical protein [Clostridia bacterium]